jgi:hypothetical protein
VVAPPGTPIVAVGDGSVQKTTVMNLDGARLDRYDGSEMPDREGIYAIEIEAAWADQRGNFFFGIQALSNEESAPNVLDVDCSHGVPRLDTAVVRAQSDGLHVSIRGADAYEIVSPRGTPPDEVFGVGGSMSARRGIPLGPGRFEVGCGTKVTPGEGTTAFELVDPAGHYAEPYVRCDGATERTYDTSIPSSTPPEDAAARAIRGLARDDIVRDGGYDAADFKMGPVYVVIRDGTTVASLILLAPGETYEARLTACPSSGLAPAPR